MPAALRAPVLGLLALAALAPLAQADPITKIQVSQSASWICVEAGASTAVAFTLVDVTTGRIAGTATATPTASSCSGGGGTSFRSDVGGSYLAGGRVVAQPSGSPAVTFDVPYATAFTTDSGTTQVVRVGGLPASSTVTIGAGAPVAVSGARYTSPSIAGFGANLVVTATVAGAPFSAGFGTSFAGFDAGGTTVDLDGADPRGGPVTVSVVSGGQTAAVVIAPTSRPRANLPITIVGDATVVVTQPGWLSHVGRAGTVAVRNDGFAVSIPVGGRGSYGVDSVLLDPSTPRAPADPLRCTSLGPSTVVTSACSTPLPDRYAANVTGLVLGAGDSARVDYTTPANDRLSTFADHLGVTGALDGFLQARIAPAIDGPLRVVASRPAGGGYAAATVRGRARAFDGSVFIQGEGDNAIPMRTTRGTVVTMTGAGLRRPLRYVFGLAATLAGSVVTGRATPGARVRVRQNRNPELLRFATAHADGTFAVPLVDPQPDEQVEITAMDLATRDTTSTDVDYGAPIVRIVGVRDQQVVRGVLHASVSAPGARRVDLGGGELPGASKTRAPFTFAVDTRRTDDGPALLSATAWPANGIPGYDDLWVIVDNTPPRASLPADAFADVGRRLRLHPGAGDANGVASVLVTWGDRRRQLLRGRKATGPLSHVYRRAGTFRVRVTVTDRAGNRRVVRTVVHAR